MWLFPPFRLDPLSQCLWRGEERVSIKPKAFALLRYLVERQERLVTKQELLEALWPGAHVEPGVLKTQVHELRQMLGDQVKPARFIETVTGAGYRFVGAIQDRATAAVSMDRQPDGGYSDVLVGRNDELALLECALGRALRGERQVVFVTGEPGIGKTMLVNSFVGSLRDHPALAVAWGQCVEQYGSGEAYLPILEALSRLARRRDGGQLAELLHRHAPTWLAQMPELIDAASLPALERATATTTGARMLRELAQALPVLAERCPLILLLEDLHWADPSTLTLIGYLARQSDPARLMIVGTFRPQEVSLTPHPLWDLVQTLAPHEQCEAIALRHLDDADIARFLDARFAPHVFPSDLGPRLRSHTSGNPLFLARVVDAMVKCGHLRQASGYWQLDAELQVATRDVPPSISALIERELIRLSDFERSVLEAACVAGAEFDASALSSALDVDPLAVEDVCMRWSRSGRFLRQQETWEARTQGLRCSFIHSLYQQVIGKSIPPARRALLHARIGAWLEANHAESLRPVAAELSMHFERAFDFARAISYRQLAGEQTLERRAYQETIQHLQGAQALMQSLPDGFERRRVELGLLLALGIPVAMTRGYASPEVERVYLRARDLCRELDDVQRLLRVVLGLSVCYAVRGMFDQASELAEQAEQLVQEDLDASVKQEANLAQLFASFHLGDLVKVQRLVARTVELYGVAQGETFAFHQDLRTTASLLISWPLWLLGHPDQARYWGENSLELATARGDHYATTQCLAYLMVVHIFRGELDLAQSRAETCNKLSVEHGFRLFHTSAMMMLGVLRVEDGDEATGIDLMLKGWESRRAVGAMVNAGFWGALIASAYSRAKMFEQARDMLNEAFALIRECGERWWEPELHRLRGELDMRARGYAARQGAQIDQAREMPEAACMRALELARSMGARSLELRAATTLSRLCDDPGKSVAARQLLASVYDSFAEGHDTRDLREAREQLKRLAGDSDTLLLAADLP